MDCVPGLVVTELLAGLELLLAQLPPATAGDPATPDMVLLRALGSRAAGPGRGFVAPGEPSRELREGTLAATVELLLWGASLAELAARAHALYPALIELPGARTAHGRVLALELVPGSNPEYLQTLARWRMGVAATVQLEYRLELEATGDGLIRFIDIEIPTTVVT
jgi:hypothetical protein